MAKVSNLRKDPHNWTTADERATEAQKGYIQTMASEVGEKIKTDRLTKAEASEKIQELQKKPVEVELSIV